METAAANKSWWQRRNWWKIGFFVLLFIFEFTREIAVLVSNDQSRIAVSANVFSVGGYTTASGQWVRTDGGERLLPTSVLIECNEDRAECLEVTTHMLTGSIGTPVIDRFKAEFAPGVVRYENENPDCARYSVRIDLDLEKVIALRERKPNSQNVNCQILEQRVEMALGNSYDNLEDPLEGHFVPLIGAIAGLSKMLA